VVIGSLLAVASANADAIDGYGYRGLQSAGRDNLLDVTPLTRRPKRFLASDFFAILGEKLTEVLKNVNGQLSEGDMEKVIDACYRAKQRAMKDAQTGGTLSIAWQATKEFLLWVYEMAYAAPTMWAAYKLPSTLFGPDVMVPYTKWLTTTNTNTNTNTTTTTTTTNTTNTATTTNTTTTINTRIVNAINQHFLPVVFALPPFLRATYLSANLIRYFLNIVRGREEAAHTRR